MLYQTQQTKLWTKSFIVLTICSFLLFLNLQMLLSSFPEYVKKEFLAGDLTVSLVTSVFALSAIVTRFMTAALMRKVHRNILLLVGLALAAVVTGVYIYADSIGSLLIMRVGYGIGFGMASTILPTLVSQIIPGNRMGEGIGYFGLSTSLAMSIGPMIGLNVMKQAGFSSLTVIGTVVVLLIFPIILLSRAIPPDTKTLRFTSAKTQRSPDSKSKSPSKQPFNNKLFIPALLNVLLAVTYGGLLSFIALFGGSVHLEQVGLFFLFNAVTIIIIRPISGRVFDTKGHAAVLIPAAISVVASLTVLSFATTTPMLILSALLYGIGFGAIQPTIQAWMLRSGSPDQHGMANSMFYNSTDFGVAAGALILGAISSVSSYALMYRYSAGFMVLFLVLFVCVQLLTNKKRRNTDTDDTIEKSHPGLYS
ncbi:MFS transporter [Paenibacillus eucommiae]|uniref:MFS family permease n=1 Tax=Paenibacillus eucommiae TaxID=1355755 RepID=A0ABS4IR28_9BACL|nr:MFS transporter [Paenibacillus eucommiae]MBP1990024.1 MFS family permease [Paenibacillus eucommiae]